MNVLFIHQNFPGQFIHLATDLANDQANKVVALTIDQRPSPKGVLVRPYTLLRHATKETHFLLRDQEAKVLRGEACAAAAIKLKHDGFEPDIIVAHPGWGEALFIRDVFPRAKLIVYCEYYYAADGQDVGFDPDEAPLTFTQRCQLRLKNTTNLLSMEIADAGISPTEWQKSTYPKWAQEKITVIHDGIDLERLKFNPNAKLRIAGQDSSNIIECVPGDEVVSYVARNLEPVRGFQVFMRMLPEVLRKRPESRAIVVGGDDVSYGKPAPCGLSWKQYLLDEIGDRLDLSRVHFVGQIGYETYLQLLSISRVHTYWTTPFVLSWSFLEAATAQPSLVASDTAPIREFANDLNVDLVNFFDSAAFSSSVIDKLSCPTAKKISPSALEKINVKRCVAAQKNLLRTLL